MRKGIRAIGVIGVGVALWALTRDDEPRRAATPEPPREREASAAPARRDDAATRARRRRALDELVERHREPTRLGKVRVVDCGLAPAAHAEVSLGAGGEMVKGLADELGVFRARVPEEAAVVTAVARVDDGEGGREGIASGAADLDVVVCPGATVEGVVRDPAGRPLAEAVVRFEEGQDVAVTDEDGEFVLTDSYLTAERVVVEHVTGSAEVALDSPLAPRERRVVDLIVTGERRLVGIVVDPSGVVRANVGIVAVDERGEVVARARSDRDGRFWLKRLPARALVLRADDGAFGTAELAVAPHVQREDVVLRLQPDRAALTVWWEGATLGRILVGAIGLGDGADPIVPETVEQRSGETRWVMTPGVYRVRVETPDETVHCGDVFLFAGAAEVVRCGALRESRLAARVLGPDGAPRPGTTWTAFLDDGNTLEGTTDAQGRIAASVTLDRATRMRIEIGRPEPEIDVLSRRNVMLSPGQTTDLGDLQLRGVEAVRAMFTERDTGTFGGLGGMLESEPLGVSFARVIRDGPLDRAGVRPGDIVLDIDGRSAGQLTEREVTLQLRGAPGSAVALRLLRPGEGRLDVELERALIDPRSGWVD
ncbi:MAG: carboxypeptidase regulatory-like domain-containing protein [Deltaproteobacteria bacterium]|nr:carboxypeptidase regulatory-like domain-containing protein [Deltaproteobacteria bacterium]